MNFEFTGESRIVFGITLKRIKALVSFGMVAKGEVGGWIEKEDNLTGDAWVSGGAHVFGGAHVSGDAQVFGNAWVSGDARVFGNAWEISPLFINLTKWSLSVSSKTTITIGCNTYTVTEWEEKADNFAWQERMTVNEITEYKLAIQYAKQWMAIYLLQEKKETT